MYHARETQVLHINRLAGQPCGTILQAEKVSNEPVAVFGFRATGK